jgi:drug/metabolite transporter (DMT)-like permease
MERGPILAVLISGALFGLSVPFSKVLVGDIRPVTLAGLLYLGAFIGLASWTMLRSKVFPAASSDPLTRGDLPYLVGGVLCGGVLAPILLMVGLERTSGSSAALLLNLEGVATVIIAVSLFHEKGGKRLWTALVAMTGASVLLSYAPGGQIAGDGTLFIVLAMVCWGIDNNLMQKISDHDSVHLALIKSAVAASVSISMAFLLFNGVAMDLATTEALLIGLVCYGASMALFMVGLRYLGSSRTGAFFSVGPYVAAVAAIPLLGENVTIQLLVAGGLMALGTWLITNEGHVHEHRHEAVEHDHLHDHTDGQHLPHDTTAGEHAHVHVHEEFMHSHVHWPDAGHGHEHEDGQKMSEARKK